MSRMWSDRVKKLESPYAKVKLEERKIQNNLNRQRSKDQEREVAKILGANRVPMSGAGFLKGDGLWNSPFGIVIYECKCSAAKHKTYGPLIRFDQKWIPKLASEAAAMKATFHFFVFHYYRQKGGYENDLVVVREDYFERFIDTAYTEHAIFYKPELLMRQNPQKALISIALFQTHIWDALNANPVFPFAYMLTSGGVHGILPVWAFKRVIDERSRITPS